MKKQYYIVFNDAFGIDRIFEYWGKGIITIWTKIPTSLTSIPISLSIGIWWTGSMRRTKPIIKLYAKPNIYGKQTQDQ